VKITDPYYLDALQRFADANGKDWRPKLWDMWLTGRDDYHPDGGILRAVRNHPDCDKVLDMVRG
jgi:hypothetical protein